MLGGLHQLAHSVFTSDLFTEQRAVAKKSMPFQYLDASLSEFIWL